MKSPERKLFRKPTADLKGPPVLRSGLVAKDDDGKQGVNSLECIEQIGEGTYGVVHKMRETNTGQLRVVKTVSRPPGWDDVQLKSEAQLLQSLDHPHILRIFSWYEDGRAVNIVMEHCSGGELLRVAKDGIQAVGKMPEGWGATAIRQALEALVYIHSKSVVHKDLKGDNLLLLESTEARGSIFGALPHVVVCDLGLAEVCKPMSSGGLFKRATENVGRARRIAGTPSTMAPEVWSGVFGQKCDIWSIGAVMYELFTSTPPFRPVKNEEKLWLEAYQKGPDLQLFSNMATEEALDLQRKLLTVKEEKRPTAEEACQHFWLVKNRRSCLSPNDLEALVKAVREWRGRNPMQRALCLKMAVGCTCLKKFASLFSQIDTDNSGVLDSSEIVPALTKLGLEQSQAADIASALDVNHDGSCEYLEFAAACLSSLEAEFDELLRQEFNNLNTEGKGWLRPDELEPLLSELRLLAASHGITMQDIDANGDGHISYGEFCTFFGRSGVVYTDVQTAPGRTALPMKHHVRILQGKREVDEFRVSMDKSMQASRELPNKKKTGSSPVKKAEVVRSPPIAEGNPGEERPEKPEKPASKGKKERRRKKPTPAATTAKSDYASEAESEGGHRDESATGSAPLASTFYSGMTGTTTGNRTAISSKGGSLPLSSAAFDSARSKAFLQASGGSQLLDETLPAPAAAADAGLATDGASDDAESLRNILRQISHSLGKEEIKAFDSEATSAQQEVLVKQPSAQATIGDSSYLKQMTSGEQQQVTSNSGIFLSKTPAAAAAAVNDHCRSASRSMSASHHSLNATTVWCGIATPISAVFSSWFGSQSESTSDSAAKDPWIIPSGKPKMRRGLRL
mmetsp:Transcript_22853/g.53461  ORF Transcript_22853/g.53461 Transcript_22853/m.53461 type:complete len:854 (+) Transcript_22853:116-2677(+)